LAALEFGVIGDDYVWLTRGDVFSLTRFYDAEGNPKNQTIQAFSGRQSFSTAPVPRNEKYNQMAAHYAEAGVPNTTLAAVGTISALYYDAGLMVCDMFLQAERKGLLTQNNSYSNIHPSTWMEMMVNASFLGASGHVSLSESGDRIQNVIALSNFIAENVTWVRVGNLYLDNRTIDYYNEVTWFDGTTDIPDLDIRPPYAYWSCHDRESGYDPTGKTISIHTPDGSNVDDIDSTYRCDGFVDCQNLSDESGGCLTDYMVMYIVFGIITGVLILILLLFFLFTLVFGFVTRRIRVQACSPIFLLLILGSCFFGYVSVFAWFGKAHPVACGFQPWLLGLGAVGMISALIAKTFRVWRVFAIPFKRVQIRDWELLIFWVVLVVPAIVILILWTIISTPTAKMKEIQGEDHYVCATGGFTEEPGGLVFFFILVAYEGILLLFGAFLTIVTRNVPVMFNESILLGISIYNLVFLAVVVIPVYMVLLTISPFAAWIVRTVAVLYAFTATLWIQFLPKVIGVIVIDKCRRVALSPKMVQISGSSSSMIGGSSQSLKTKTNTGDNQSLSDS